jgi:hypothetical protein
MRTLKGWFPETIIPYFGTNVRFIYFNCPICSKHNDCIPVYEGEHVDVMGHAIWHWEMKDGKVLVQPSIDASQSSCPWHDMVEFELVHSEDEL